MIFKGAFKQTLHAWVCGSCGYIELYVDNPEELWEFHKKRGLTGSMLDVRAVSPRASRAQVSNCNLRRALQCRNALRPEFC